MPTCIRRGNGAIARWAMRVMSTTEVHPGVRRLWRRSFTGPVADAGADEGDRGQARPPDGGEVTAEFSTSLRGYDRAQVDEAIRVLNNKLTVARSHATSVQARLEEVLAEQDATSGHARLGPQMEKVLRAAGREAAELRESAHAEANVVLARAREAAEVSEARLRERWNQLRAAEAAAERQAQMVLDAAGRRADELISAAEEEARSARDRAHEQVKQTLEDTAHTAHQLLEQGRLEVERLESMRDSVRAELDRLLRALTGVRDALSYELQARSGPPSDSTAPLAAGPAFDVPQGLRLGRRRHIDVRDAPAEIADVGESDSGDRPGGRAERPSGHGVRSSGGP